MRNGHLKSFGYFNNWFVQLSKLRATLQKIVFERLREEMDPTDYERILNHWESGDWQENPRQKS